MLVRSSLPVPEAGGSKSVCLYCTTRWCGVVGLPAAIHLCPRPVPSPCLPRLIRCHKLHARVDLEKGDTLDMLSCYHGGASQFFSLQFCYADALVKIITKAICSRTKRGSMGRDLPEKKDPGRA